MRTRSHRGSALLMTVVVIMVVFTLGCALLDLTTTSLFRSKNDMLRAQALDVAEAGVEKAIYYLRNTAPDGSVDGSWRTTGLTSTLSTVGSYTFSAADGTGDDIGKIVIISAGTASVGSKSVRRRLRVVITRTDENVSVWNNVIFGGVGQTGHSINGNVVMRGSVHLLGEGEPYTDSDGDGKWDDNEPYTDSNHNGQYDIGEPFTDSDRDGHRDAREAFVDLNGNGTWDPPLTVTDLADEIGGTANIGNNYSGMSSTLSARVPTLATQTVGGVAEQSLSAKLRVKHGQISISGAATVGSSTSGGSPAVKGTMTGAYVNDGWSGTAGASNVYSDNGTTKAYDLGDFVSFPDVVSSETVSGTTYTSHMSYLSSAGMTVSGPLNLQPNQAYSVSDTNGNSLSVDGHGNMSVHGIVYVNGDINLNRGSGSGNDTFTYSTGPHGGTLVSTGNISVHTNLLSTGTFPTSDVIGMVARHQLNLATGSGDSQLTMMGAFYAQEQVQSQKQNEIAGTFVSSYFAMQNVPHMYQIPALAANLPPGMPGSNPIWIVTTQVNSWTEIALS
jgi:hypothetical protein